jgi:hypothetical protein
MAAENISIQPSKPADPQGSQHGAPAGAQQVQVRVDESKMVTCYANAFGTNGTDEEIMIDFGTRSTVQPQTPGGSPSILFQSSQRVVMSYYSAKRLAIALGQAIRGYEQQFGELELDAAKRQKAKGR